MNVRKSGLDYAAVLRRENRRLHAARAVHRKRERQRLEKLHSQLMENGVRKLDDGQFWVPSTVNHVSLYDTSFPFAPRKSEYVHREEVKREGRRVVMKAPTGDYYPRGELTMYVRRWGACRGLLSDVSEFRTFDVMWEEKGAFVIEKRNGTIHHAFRRNAGTCAALAASMLLLFVLL